MLSGCNSYYEFFPLPVLCLSALAFTFFFLCVYSLFNIKDKAKAKWPQTAQQDGFILDSTSVYIWTWRASQRASTVEAAGAAAAAA